jgi:hypothetical protein
MTQRFPSGAMGGSAKGAKAELPRKARPEKKQKKFSPVILRPLSEDYLAFLRRHVAKLKEPLLGKPCHDQVYGRFAYHNPSALVWLHDTLVPLAAEIFGEKVKSSYAFLSMYTDKGVCPRHTDRPQCKYTIDLCISQGSPWEIFVEGEAYCLQEGEALCFSGTDQEHWRDPIGGGNFCDLAFFHFVPLGFKGSLE